MSDEIMGLCDFFRGSSAAVAAAARTMMGPEISLGINGVSTDDTKNYQAT
jgi:hypothetical protein